MGAGHVHALFLHGQGRLHRIAPQCKLVALLLFVFAVVSTPREAFWAYGTYALVLVALARFGSVPLVTLLRRLVIELPFVAFAVFLPFIGGGDRIDVLGLQLSTEGLWGAWNILVKGTLGVAASLIMAATTPVPEILHGMQRLRLPRVFTAIAGFMVRYLDVTSDEVRRMAVARASRGYEARWIWQARAVAATAGTLFVRSFERGERVHLAMVSRGYDGALPLLEAQEASRAQWLWSLTVPALAAIVSVAAWTVLR